MPLKVIRQDITKMKVDAIVNAAKRTLLGGGGVDGAIHRAAGPELLEECKTLKGCDVGESKLTKGYNLPAKYVIHTVGPIWKGGYGHEEELLRSCYKNSLSLAKKSGIESIAFPLISSGVYGYPKKEALKVAVDTATEFLLENDMLVYIVVFDPKAVLLSKKLYSDIKEYIDDNYAFESLRESRADTKDEIYSKLDKLESYSAPKILKERSLKDLTKELDETFQQKLFRFIDQKNFKDSETYRKANIDRRLFSKIRSDKNYTPSKQTAVSLAIALELSLDETKDLLGAAGMTLSKSSMFDVVVMYFIEREIYDMFSVNEALFEFCETTL